MDFQAIKDFVLKHNLEERSITGFWNYFHNYQKEYSEEFQKEFPDDDVNHVELFIDCVSLRITNWHDDGYNHVIIVIRMHYKEQHAGMYNVVYNLSGDVEDDHLPLF